MHSDALIHIFNEVNIEGHVGGIKNLFMLYQFNIYPNFLFSFTSS